MQKELRKALVKYSVMGLVQAAILRFVSGRAAWSRAWIYVGFILGFQVIAGTMLNRTSPDLLVERSRIQQGTKSWDKLLAPIVALVCPLSIWCVASLDVRFHWPPPVPVVWSAAALLVCTLGFLFSLSAMAANRFFSATVRIQSERGHKLVDSGPYRYVRHPGYSGALAFSLASPVALGSWLALIPAVFTVVVLVVRTILEDRTLRQELEGYEKYARRVPARLVPGIW